MKKEHLEQRPGETFVGNAKVDEWPYSYLPEMPSARMGEVAFDINGERLDPEHIRPVFVGHEDFDAYNRAMEEHRRAILRGEVK